VLVKGVREAIPNWASLDQKEKQAAVEKYVGEHPEPTGHPHRRGASLCAYDGGFAPLPGLFWYDCTQPPAPRPPHSPSRRAAQGETETEGVVVPDLPILRRKDFVFTVYDNLDEFQVWQIGASLENDLTRTHTHISDIAKFRNGISREIRPIPFFRNPRCVSCVSRNSS
jgi:hypothetical protein